MDFAVARLKPKGGVKTIGEVAAELLESKRLRFGRGDLRERSFSDFSERSARFAEAFQSVPAHEFTSEVLKQWLIDMELAPRSVKNFLAVASEVLKFACQKKYITYSPVDDLTDTDRKELCGSTEAKEPSILTVGEAERLVLAASEHPELELLGFVTLGLFCGIRVEELNRLDWSSVRDTEELPIVTISAKIAKKRRIRHVDIPRNALKWLSLQKDRSGTLTAQIHRSEHYKRFSKLLKLAGFGRTDESGKWESDWPSNALRHSFGTYHYALHGNPMETAKQMGHKASDQVLFDHYRALATKEQGEAFFAIAPPKSEAKLVEFA